MSPSEQPENLAEGRITGPWWPARNWSADAGEGSIHDDATAERLGFRGGTVAGDVHMNQFPAQMLKIFGERWFDNGHLSLLFRNATVDLEKVAVYAQVQPDANQQIRTWMERDDGLLVCEGSAGGGHHEQSALQTRDLRPGDPADLKILHRLSPGLSLGEYDVHASPDKQFWRYDNQLLSDPLPWYRHTSPWGAVIGAPCTLVQYLWGYPMQVLGELVGESVGLFGAIEIAFHGSPFLLNQDYHLSSRVVCVGQSPQTEFVWYDTDAFNTQGERVASLRMQSRAMKSSSPAYAGSSS